MAIQYAELYLAIELHHKALVFSSSDKVEPTIIRSIAYKESKTSIILNSVREDIILVISLSIS
jgi:hypothetical protein